MDRLAKVGIVIIATMIAVYLAITLIMSTQRYLTVSDITSGEYRGKKVSVLGRVVNGSITVAGSQFAFNLTDGLKDLEVRYVGSANLSGGDEVVVEGTYTEEGWIEAQQILTGCASKYVGPQSSIFQDPVILGGSIVIPVLFTALLLIEYIRRRK